VRKEWPGAYFHGFGLDDHLEFSREKNVTGFLLHEIQEA
jgi:hypothetical protein